MEKQKIHVRKYDESNFNQICPHLMEIKSTVSNDLISTWALIYFWYLQGRHLFTTRGCLIKRGRLLKGGRKIESLRYFLIENYGYSVGTGDAYLLLLLVELHSHNITMAVYCEHDHCKTPKL